MTKILMFAAITMAVAAPAIAQKTASAGKSETLRVSAINLAEEDFTEITLKDAAGVKLETTKVPLTVCKRDRLGRLLPGLDVKMLVETKMVAGKRVRFVRPERFKAWCS